MNLVIVLPEISCWCLKHESYLNKVNNPADGAYYIESLTSQLCEKALDIFKDIESNGGFFKQLKDGTIQRKIKESAIQEQQQFDKEEEVLLGTNKHPNGNDKMKDNLELFPFVKTKKRKTIIEPIIESSVSRKIRTRTIKIRINILIMKIQLKPLTVLLISFLLVGCKKEATLSEFKYSANDFQVTCEEVNPELFKEAVYSFEDDITKYFAQKGTKNLSQAYSRAVNLGIYGRAKYEEIASPHTIEDLQYS